MKLTKPILLVTVILLGCASCKIKPETQNRKAQSPVQRRLTIPYIMHKA